MSTSHARIFPRFPMTDPASDSDPDASFAPTRPALLLLSEKMRILMVSPAASELLARPATELAGKRVGELFQHEPVIDVQLLFRNQPTSIQAFPARLANVEPEREHVSLHAILMEGEATTSPQYLLTITPVQAGETPLPQLGGVQIVPTEFITHLARGFTHKFNNILTILSGYTELLTMEPEPSDMLKNSIAQFQNVSEQSRELIRFLDRIGGLIGVDLMPVSSREIVNRATAQIEQLLEAPPKITSMNAGDQPQLFCDPQRVVEVLAELTKNAQEAGATAVVYSFSIVEEKGEAEITVTDNGGGIQLERPVECLFVGRTSHDSELRHGVGLPSALGVMRAMNGSLQLKDTEPGKTTFCLTLPLVSGNHEPR